MENIFMEARKYNLTSEFYRDEVVMKHLRDWYKLFKEKLEKWEIEFGLVVELVGGQLNLDLARNALRMLQNILSGKRISNLLKTSVKASAQTLA